MPAESGRQYRFMQAICHGGKSRSGKGPSKAQACEYVEGQSPKGLPETKKTVGDFPLIGGDKKINIKIDRPKGPATPKPTISAPKPKSPSGIRGKLMRAKEVIEDLQKEVWHKDPTKVKEMLPFHAVISPAGKVHQLAANDSHHAAMQHHSGEKHSYSMNDHMSSGWIATGHAGHPHISGNEEVLHDREHPATRALAQHIKKLPHHIQEITVSTGRTRNSETGDVHYEGTHKVPRRHAEAGNFSAPSITQQFHRSDDELMFNLLKAFERRDDYTLVDPREYYGALQAVNKRVLSWTSAITKGMKVNESKEVPMFVDGALLKIRKLANDMYSGWIIDKTGDINHLYDRLTLPALASQIMALYELYNDDDNKKKDKPSLRSLKEEIESLNAQLKDKSNSTDIEARIKHLIESLDKVGDDHTDLKDKHDKLVGRTESELNRVHDKLNQLKGMLEPKTEKEANMPNTMAVRQIGEPGSCADCGSNPCKCYTHLSKPTIEVAPTGKITIMFKSDWQSLDKLNFLKTMKYVVDKKRN